MLTPGYYCVKCEAPTAQLVECSDGYVMSCTDKDCQHDEPVKVKRKRAPKRRRE